MRLFANAYKRELYSKGGCGDTMYIIYCGVEHKGNQLTALHPLHLDPTRGLLQFPRAQNISPLGQQIHLGSVFWGDIADILYRNANGTILNEKIH